MLNIEDYKEEILNLPIAINAIFESYEVIEND